MGDRAIRWLVGGLGLLVGIAAELVQRGHAIPAERLLVDFLVGQAYLMGGLFAWSREPRNRTWKLMAGVGIAWYVGSFAVSSVPIVRDLAVVLADADAILLVALVLAYPTGRLERPSERLVVFGGAVGLTLGNVMLLLVHDSTVALVIGLAVTLAMAILVPRRWLLATPRHRRLLAPTLVATAITLLAIGAAIVGATGGPASIGRALRPRGPGHRAAGHPAGLRGGLLPAGGGAVPRTPRRDPRPDRAVRPGRALAAARDR